MKLEEKAMLVRLSIGVYEGRKKDKIVEEDTNVKYGSKNAFSVRKVLFDSPELKAVQTIATHARDRIHRVLTLPWMIDGTGILPIANYDRYMKEVRADKDAFESAVQALLPIWDTLIEKEKVRLNGAFRLSDYPTKQEVEKSFKFSVSFFPIPTSGDFRVQMQSDEVASIRQDLETEMSSTLTNASRDLYGRIYGVVKNMQDVLSNPKPKIFDSLVKNIADLVAILPSLNLTGDDRMTDLTKLLEEELANLDPDDLRDSKELREVTAEMAGEILKEIDPAIQNLEELL